ncbi:MAG: hypothetical protein R3E50_13740 [Halioglobus sp.]
MLAACIAEGARQQVKEQLQLQISTLLREFRACVSGHIILTILPSTAPPGLGLYDVGEENSEDYWWSQTKASLARNLREDFSGVNVPIWTTS